jgi:hypothetical protein
MTDRAGLRELANAKAELELVRGHHRPDICYEQGCFACRAYWVAVALLDLLDQYERVAIAARPVVRLARFCHKDDYAFMKLDEALEALNDSLKEPPTPTVRGDQPKEGDQGVTTLIEIFDSLSEPRGEKKK